MCRPPDAPSLAGSTLLAGVVPAESDTESYFPSSGHLRAGVPDMPSYSEEEAAMLLQYGRRSMASASSSMANTLAAARAAEAPAVSRADGKRSWSGAFANLPYRHSANVPLLPANMPGGVPVSHRRHGNASSSSAAAFPFPLANSCGPRPDGWLPSPLEQANLLNMVNAMSGRLPRQQPQGGIPPAWAPWVFAQQGNAHQAADINSLQHQLDPEMSLDFDGNFEEEDGSNEKKVRRMLSNRASAKRSRQRRQQRLEELEVVTAKLRVENASLGCKLSDTQELARKLYDENILLKRQLEKTPEVFANAEKVPEEANTMSPRPTSTSGSDVRSCAFTENVCHSDEGAQKEGIVQELRNSANADKVNSGNVHNVSSPSASAEDDRSLLNASVLDYVSASLDGSNDESPERFCPGKLEDIVDDIDWLNTLECLETKPAVAW